MRFRPSVRFRLTLWNAAILAAVLGVFAYGSWGVLVVQLGLRADAAVSESARAVSKAIVNERKASRALGDSIEHRDMAREALRELRAGDLDVFIVDEASQVVASSLRKGKRTIHLPKNVKGVDTVTRTASITKGDTLRLPAPVRTLLHQVQTSTIPADTLPTVHSINLDDGPHRVAVVRISGTADSEEPAMVVVAIRATDDDQNLLARVRTDFFFAIPIALLVSIALGYAIARRSLAPIEAMAMQAARISAATLDERLPVANAHDELGRLATVVNALLERVQGAFRQQRQFVADASHELRTPIAIVRGEADVTLQRPNREEKEYREALFVIQDESVRLTRIVDDLFVLARTDAGAPVAVHKSLDLRELALGAVRSVR
ncbi:MAG: HAMP domain-containing protein, partial [Gemmatimonadota bacterium]|nr:HAMP domain-containing protein [Gemmatimonadota bacterium]